MSDFLRSNPNIKREMPSFELGSETIAKNDPNQDAILINESSGLFAVIDGAGGMEDGEKASKVAKSSMDQSIEQNPNIGLSELILQASRDVSNSTVGVATGAVVRVLEKNQATGTCRIEAATIGDSRVYVIGKDGNIKFVSIDNIVSDTPDGRRRMFYEQQQRLSSVLFDDDLITEDHYAFDNRNQIHACIGGHFYDSAEVYELEISEGDIILITSDGIHDNLTDDEIASMANPGRSSSEIARALAARSVSRAGNHELRSKHDDTSVIVMKYSNGETSGQNQSLEELTQTREVPLVFTDVDLERDRQMEYDIRLIPFPLKLYIGTYELQLSLDEREGQEPGLVIALPGKSAGEYLSGKYVAEIPHSENPGTVIIGREQQIEELLGVEFPMTVSHKHLEVTYGKGKLILKDTSTNGTIIMK